MTPRPSATTGTVFSIIDPALAAGGSEVLGVWRTVPTGPSDALAFEAPPTVREGQWWEVELSADLSRAAQDLGRVEQRLAASRRALPEAEARLASFARHYAAGVAFDVDPAAVVAAEPEAELIQLLESLERRQAEVTFGPAERLLGGWNRAAGYFQAGISQLAGVISVQATVETRVEGLLLGRTRVALAGGLETVWRNGLSPSQVALHRRALDLALESRHTLLRTLVSATRGAAMLASLPLLLGTPGGTLLALPMAWRFINTVLADRQV